jgi:integrase
MTTVFLPETFPLTPHPRFFVTQKALTSSANAYPGTRANWLGDYVFAGRLGHGRNLSAPQYARLVSTWIASIGLDPRLFGTHSLRRTKATLIYRRTGNLGAVQLLLGHTKIESTVRYLGIEVDDAIAIAEQVDV